MAVPGSAVPAKVLVGMTYEEKDKLKAYAESQGRSMTGQIRYSVAKDVEEWEAQQKAKENK